MNYNICKPGERLKRIRIRINMKQSELSGKTITRNLVSMIENGKSSLTMKTAMILADNINKFCKENNKTFSVTPQELVYSEESQAKDIAAHFMKLMDSLGMDFLKFDSKTHLDKMKEILSRYDLIYEKAVIYEKLGELYSDGGNYDIATTYLFLAYEYMSKVEIENKFERLALIILKLVHGKKQIRKYDEALNISFSFKNSIFFKNCTKVTQSRVIYNNAVCLKKTKEFEQCLEEIEILENEYFNELGTIEFRVAETLILKANCKSALHFTGEAIKINKKLIKSINDNLEYLIVTYCNLIDIYLKLKDSKNAKVYLALVEEKLNDYESSVGQNFYCEIFKSLADAYREVELSDNAEKMYLKAYARGRLRSDKRTINHSLSNLLELYIQADDHKQIESFKNLLAECATLKLIDPSSYTILRLIEYYTKKKDFEAIQNIIDFAK